MRLSPRHLALTATYAATALACVDPASSPEPEIVTAQADEPETPVESAIEIPADKVYRHDPSESLPGHYWVVMKHEASARMAPARRAQLDASIDRLALAHKADVSARYDAALAGFAAKMAEPDALALAQDSEVAWVEQVPIFRTAAVMQSSATWGLDRIDHPSRPMDTKYLQLGQGEGATIYIIDTGIRGVHVEFTGRMKPGYAGVADGAVTGDCNGHGTHVAGTAAGSTWGVAKKAWIVPVRVLDCAGVTVGDSLINGINWVAQNRVAKSVANLSLAGPSSPTINQATRGAIAAGVTMVTAAGNENHSASLHSPANEPLAITVGASDRNDVRSTFSNYGTVVDITAPGTGIMSAAISDNVSGRLENGTSMASPHVAGVVAVYIALHPTATPAQIQAKLKEKAALNKLSPTGLNGTPNRLLYSRFVDDVFPTVKVGAPMNGATVAPAFDVTVNAADANLWSVRLKVDDGTEVALTKPPWVFPVKDLAEGSHKITMTAIDWVGQKTVAYSAVTVSKDAPPGGENPGGENPDPENPDPENPGGENPGGENPGGENPGGGSGSGSGSANTGTGEVSGCAVAGPDVGFLLALALLGLTRRRKR